MNDSEARKQLEEDRTARRARARAAAAQNDRYHHVEADVRAVQAGRTPKPWGRRRYTERKVEQHVRNIDNCIEDAKLDYPEVDECSLAHDIAWSFIGGIKNWEHPQVVREVRQHFDVWAD